MLISDEAIYISDQFGIYNNKISRLMRKALKDSREMFSRAKAGSKFRTYTLGMYLRDERSRASHAVTHRGATRRNARSPSVFAFAVNESSDVTKKGKAENAEARRRYRSTSTTTTSTAMATVGEAR